ncbi:hypothetical protein B0H19DRAFT_1060411 [Mycena capillaripes]|nr:hypothetical protein B0H19DRAFT_1060411 [Mycena capillaripes]
MTDGRIWISRRRRTLANVDRRKKVCRHGPRNAMNGQRELDLRLAQTSPLNTVGGMVEVDFEILGGVPWVAKRFLNIGAGEGQVDIKENLEQVAKEAARLSRTGYFLKHFIAEAKKSGVDIEQGFKIGVEVVLGNLGPSNASEFSLEQYQAACQAEDEPNSDSDLVVWLFEPRQYSRVKHWSGTNEYPPWPQNKLGSTLNAFAHYAYLFSLESILLADLQTATVTDENGEGIQVLFDMMMHTLDTTLPTFLHLSLALLSLAHAARSNTYCGLVGLCFSSGRDGLNPDKTMMVRTQIMLAGLKMEHSAAATWWNENRTDLKALKSWESFVEKVKDSQHALRDLNCLRTHDSTTVITAAPDRAHTLIYPNGTTRHQEPQLALRFEAEQHQHIYQQELVATRAALTDPSVGTRHHILFTKTPTAEPAPLSNIERGAQPFEWPSETPTAICIVGFEKRRK